MKIAPVDITHKNFGRKVWGLDPDQVGEFLRNIAEEMESLLKERNQLREGMREKELSLIEYRERDKILKDTIATAQKMAERLREDAERESKLILNDSNQKAEIIIRDARDSLKRIYREISDLQRFKSQFETNMKALLQAHSSLLEQGDSYLPKVQLPNVDLSQGGAASVVKA